MERLQSDNREDDAGREEAEGRNQEVKNYDLYDLIWNSYLPLAIKFCIPYEVFWDINPRILMIYSKEYEDNEKKKLEQQEFTAYMHGIYVQHAVSSVLNGRKSPYPKKPLGIVNFEEKEIDPEIERKRILQKAEAWAIDQNYRGLPDSGMK